jgi:xanthine dehydrogenase molybdenum-binding subunit
MSMEFKTVGKSVKRHDAVAKVTGKANYTRDFETKDMLHAKILRSKIAHGYVKSYDISKAQSMPGVVKVILPKDVKAKNFPTAGHPHSLDPDHQDIPDRQILNEKIRVYGDEIGVVIAVDEITAERAVRSIKVEYDELPFVLDAEKAMEEGAVKVHELDNNIIAHSHFLHGDLEPDEAFKKADYIFEDVFDIAPVQHAHLENHVAYAYIDYEDKLTVVSSTQIPHICRRVVADCLELPYSKVRVIKPYIGGGFGNKQDVCIEPMVAMLTQAVNGKLVMLDLTREEVFYSTRTRHGIKFYFKTGINKDGKIVAKKLKAIGNNGAYASHGHSIVAKGGTNFSRSYPAEYSTEFDGFTVYTNIATAGAMRGYGIPQANFAVETHLDDIAEKIGMDPIEFKQKNMVWEGYVDPLTGIEIKTCGLKECIAKGKEYIEWDKKREEYKNQTGDKRRGVGFACFSYATAVWPYAMELAGARVTLSQDGSVNLTVGATEIGQGSDTVLSQMVAEVMGIPYEMVNVTKGTDTDITPYDPGAYASRQTYVAGQAVKAAAKSVKKKILKRAAKKLGMDRKLLTIDEAMIIDKKTKKVLISLKEIALETFYSKDGSSTIASEKSVNVKSNALAFGVCVTEVEVDIKTGVVKIIKICNIHDSGKIINPLLARGQVEGGMSMSLGMALTETMTYNKKTGELLNDNFLDYKIPTTLDTPDFDVDFVETYEKSGPFGNKALGEPPAVPPAPALRNAIAHATGVRVNKTPMNPQSLFDAFKEAGLI